MSTATELPDRDDDCDPVGPSVVCDHCNLDLGEHPAGSYVHCEECDDNYLAVWPKPSREPTDEEMRAYDAAWSAARDREAYAQLAADNNRLIEERDTALRELAELRASLRGYALLKTTAPCKECGDELFPKCTHGTCFECCTTGTCDAHAAVVNATTRE